MRPWRLFRDKHVVVDFLLFFFFCGFSYSKGLGVRSCRVNLEEIRKLTIFNSYKKYILWKIRLKIVEFQIWGIKLKLIATKRRQMQNLCLILNTWQILAVCVRNDSEAKKRSVFNSAKAALSSQPITAY